MADSVCCSPTARPTSASPTIRGTSAAHVGPVTAWPVCSSRTQPSIAGTLGAITSPSEATTCSAPAPTSRRRESCSSTRRPATPDSANRGSAKAMKSSVISAGCSLSEMRNDSTTKAIESPKNDKARAGSTNRMSR